MHAVMNNHIYVVQFLIKFGAGLDFHDDVSVFP